LACLREEEKTAILRANRFFSSFREEEDNNGAPTLSSSFQLAKVDSLRKRRRTGFCVGIQPFFFFY
jgi:hypothetical protein